MMPKYITSYKVYNNWYGSHIYAKSFKEAERIAAIRNIAEKVTGPSLGIIDGYGRKVPEELANPDFRKLSDYDFVKQLPDIIHTTCFLGYIASHSTTKFTDLVSDEGILHELIHLMVSKDTTTRMVRRARGKFYALQDSIPGYFPTIKRSSRNYSRKLNKQNL